MSAVKLSILSLLVAVVTGAPVDGLDPYAPAPPGNSNSFIKLLKLHNFWSRFAARSFYPKEFVNPLPPRPSYEVSSTNGVLSVQARSLSPPLYDLNAGVCESIIRQGSLLHSAQLYSTRKIANLATAIMPKDITCRTSSPIADQTGRCAMIGYPHGAWVLYTEEEKNALPIATQALCQPLEGRADTYRCWDYVVVPGACVLLKR